MSPAEGFSPNKRQLNFPSPRGEKQTPCESLKLLIYHLPTINQLYFLKTEFQFHVLHNINEIFFLLCHPYLLTYQTPMAGDLQTCYSEWKSRRLSATTFLSLKFWYTRKTNIWYKLYVNCTYTSSFAICFDMLLQF